MSPALRAVEQIYFELQRNLNMMLEACPSADSDACRRTLGKRLVEARINYYACINKAFHDDDPDLQQLVAQAKVATAKIAQMETELGDIAHVIASVTEAVNIGAQIATQVIKVV